MSKQRFHIDPCYIMMMVMLFVPMVIPLLIILIGAKLDVDQEQVGRIARFFYWSLPAVIYPSMMIVVAFRGSHIHHAARSGQTWHIKKLLQKGRSINRRTWLKRTPLHIACKAGKIESVKFLIENGADVIAKDVSGKTPGDLTDNEAILNQLKRSQDLSQNS